MISSLFECSQVVSHHGVHANSRKRVPVRVTLAIALLSISFSARQDVRAQDLDSANRKSNTESSSDSANEIRKHLSVPYAKYDNDRKLLCDIYVPPGKGPFPAILMIHGGAWKSGTKLHMKFHAQSAAKQGFVVISINYRHAPRYKWPAQIEDCTEALRWMAKNKTKYEIDTKRIALWGYSAGGHLATYLATRKSGKTRLPEIQCLVCGSAPLDLTVFDKDFPFLVYFMGATRREAPEKYEEASPVKHLTKDAPPMFLYIGENDHALFQKGMQNMVEKAKKVGVKCELMKVPDKEHFLTFFDQPSFDRALTFIQKSMAAAEQK